MHTSYYGFTNNAEYMEENKVLIKSFIDEVFNQHDLTAIDKYHSPCLTSDSGKTVELFKKYLTALHYFQALQICM
jgi:hypothetical protein